MGENWVGKAVSIKCIDDVGIFQGIIKDADSSKIIISKAFRNGLPIKTLDAEVTIMATDIVKISLLPNGNAANVNDSILTSSNGDENGETTTNGRYFGRDAKTSSPNSNNLKQNTNRRNYGEFIPAKVEVKLTSTITTAADYNAQAFNKNFSTPIDINRQYRDHSSKKRNNYNNDTFSTPVNDPLMNEDFDFEKNLALFDKQAVFNKIDGKKVEKQIKKNARKNYRHDENILASTPTNSRQITMKNHSTNQYFVTDDGLIVPSISLSLRNRIMLQAEVFGLSWERQCDSIARGAVELALNIIGGARLSIKNHHQWPKVTIICKDITNNQTDIGLSTGRQLAAQGLKVFVLTLPTNSTVSRNNEVELFKSTGNVITTSVDDLPSSDLIILSVQTPLTDLKLNKWITDSRALLMAIDPPTSGVSNLNIKCSILPLLPLENIDSTCGKLYLANLSIPEKFYRDAGVDYKSPFAHKFIIPLHLQSDNNQNGQRNSS